MKKSKILSVILAFLVTVTGTNVTGMKVNAETEPMSNDGKSASQAYVEAMGHGWNLGNSFDGFEADLELPDPGETAWGNPAVTQDLIKAVKGKGYSSIRIPFTVYRRYTVNENAGENEYKYVIDANWLARYKEVVDWAVSEDLYVMINIHHDSWIWLKYWNGDESAEEYRMYTDFWKQMAEYFKDEPEKVCFETINEPDFSDSDGISAQQKLDKMNRAAYDIIRGITENANRMIVMPTTYTKTDAEPCAALGSFIQSLNDANVIATVHYYCEWVYSANLGKTGFDEALWDEYTPRNAVDTMMNTIDEQFISKGIGVIVGEYGLLGYDASENCLQTGEELKYYEYMNYLAQQHKVCLVFWDNGSGINRTDFTWKKPLVGSMLETSMTTRSSYATGLDTIYLKGEVAEDIAIPLTLNGNTFTGIEGLTEGTDYSYDASTATVTLKKEYVNQQLANAADYGTFAELVFKFYAGADWHQYLVKYDTPKVGSAQGDKSGIEIPVTFNGSKVKRMMTYQASGKVGPNSSWWDYLQYDGSFSVDYQNGSITLKDALFYDDTVKDGWMKAKVEFYDGQTMDIWLKVEGNTVTSSPEYAQDVKDMGVSSDIICLYAGETEIPGQYLQMPEGASVYGTYTNDDTMVQLEGWPAKMIFDTKAHADFTQMGIKICYMDIEKYVDVSLGIKDAPVVTAAEVKAGEQGRIAVSNLADDAQLTYKSGNEAIAKVSSDGIINGVSEGTATITVTVTQYNRTDSFETVVKVTENDKRNNENNQSSTQEGQNPIVYPVKKAENLTWNMADNKDMVITVDVDFEKFTNVMIDGVLMDTSHYSAAKGSTIITVKKEYLKTLSAGNHVIRINFTDGYAEVTATIVKDSSNPKTGDTAPIAGFILLGAAAFLVLADQKKHLIRK